MIRPNYNEDTFPHWTTIPIRFRDLDTLNHVNNAIFSTYYEEARITFIRQIPTLADQVENGFSFVLANLKIDFVNPLQHPSDISVGTGIKSLGTSRITSFQAIYTSDDKQLVSVFEARGVWFDLSKQRPTKVPELLDSDKFLLPDTLFE